MSRVLDHMFEDSNAPETPTRLSDADAPLPKMPATEEGVLGKESDFASLQRRFMEEQIRMMNAMTSTFGQMQSSFAAGGASSSSSVAVSAPIQSIAPSVSVPPSAPPGLAPPVGEVEIKSYVATSIEELVKQHSERLALEAIQKFNTIAKSHSEKFEKLMRLNNKVKKMQNLFTMIDDGEWQSSLKRFKFLYDSPMNETRITTELSSFLFGVEPESTILETRKVFYEKSTAYLRRLDHLVYSREADALKPEVTLQPFVEKCRKLLTDKSQAINLLGDKLGIDLKGGEASSNPSQANLITEKKAKELYDKLTTKIANTVMSEDARLDQHKKQVEAKKLRVEAATPKELLQRTIAQEISTVLQKSKGSGKQSGQGGFNRDKDKGVDYAQAFLQENQDFSNCVDDTPPDFTAPKQKQK